MSTRSIVVSSWERPASLELIDPQDGGQFQINAGLRIRGGFSRSGNNPKHAFRAFFRDEYGDKKLAHALFGEEGVDEFDNIDFRTAQNYSWSFQGDSRNTLLREVFSRDTQMSMGRPYTRSRHYHLYLNGQYWGHLHDPGAIRSELCRIVFRREARKTTT